MDIQIVPSSVFYSQVLPNLNTVIACQSYLAILQNSICAYRYQQNAFVKIKGFHPTYSKALERSINTLLIFEIDILSKISELREEAV